MDEATAETLRLQTLDFPSGPVMSGTEQSENKLAVAANCYHVSWLVPPQRRAFPAAKSAPRDTILVM